MRGIIILEHYDEDAFYKVQKTDATWEYHNTPGNAFTVKKLPKPMPESENIVFDNPNNLTLGQIWQQGYNYCLKEILGQEEEE